MRRRLITGPASRRVWLVTALLVGAALVTTVAAFRYYLGYRQAVQAR